MNKIIKYSKFLIVFIILLWNIIHSQISNDDIFELQKKTLPFINISIDTWKQINSFYQYSFSNRIKVYTEILISPNLKNDINKLNLCILNIKNFDQKKYKIFEKNSRHIVEIKFPVIINDLEKKLMLYFKKVPISSNIYRWKIVDAQYPHSPSAEQYFGGLKELEVEKQFSNFIDDVSSNQNLTKYLNISQEIITLIENINNKKIKLTSKSHNVELIYYLLDVPYGNDLTSIQGYKYVIFKYYNTIPKTKQTGWLLEDEGEMYEYYQSYQNKDAYSLIEDSLLSKSLNTDTIFIDNNNFDIKHEEPTITSDEYNFRTAHGTKVDTLKKIAKTDTLINHSKEITKNINLSNFFFGEQIGYFFILNETDSILLNLGLQLDFYLSAQISKKIRLKTSAGIINIPIVEAQNRKFANLITLGSEIQYFLTTKIPKYYIFGGINFLNLHFWNSNSSKDIVKNENLQTTEIISINRYGGINLFAGLGFGNLKFGGLDINATISPGFIFWDEILFYNKNETLLKIDYHKKLFQYIKFGFNIEFY